MKKDEFLSRVQVAGDLPDRRAAEQWETARALRLDREAFLQHVAAALGVHVPEAERAVLVVWRVLTQAVSAGEIEDFEACIPKDIAGLLERGA